MTYKYTIHKRDVYNADLPTYDLSELMIFRLFQEPTPQEIEKQNKDKAMRDEILRAEQKRGVSDEN